MAEIAALSNLSAVVCCGVKLSISLYEFEASLSSASRELKNLGSDIAHFCSVLKQVQSFLRRAKSFKVLPYAIQTTQNIVDKSHELFDEISAILSKLRKHGRSQVDLRKRVKWTLKKPKVLLLQEGLRSCDAMFQLMLTTMSFAQILAATKRYSRLDSNADDEEQRALIHSLFLAQQSSNERLEELEDECFLEDGLDTSSEYTQAASPLPLSPPTSPEELKRSLNEDVTDRSQSNQSVHPHGKNSKRTSTLLSALLYQQANSRERRRLAWTNLTDHHRQSVIQSDILLQTWTDQRDPLAWEQASDDLKDEEERGKSWRTVDHLPYERSRSDSTSLDTTNDADDEKPTSDKRNSLNLPEIVESTHILPENDAETLPPYQTSNSVVEPRVCQLFRVGLEDSCRTVLPAMLWKYEIMEEWKDYLLYLVCIDGERLIQLEEKPLLLFKELDKAGKKPTFMLRRKNGGPVDKPALGSDEGLPEVVSGWASKSDEELPEVIENQPQRTHPLPELIQSHPHPGKARSTEAFERSQRKLAKLTGLTYPIADAPELVETLLEIDKPQPEALYPYTEPDTPPRPAPIKVSSSEAVERSQQKLAKLTGLSYIPQGGASLDKPRNSNVGTTTSVSHSAMTSPTRDLDTFDGYGALLQKWITRPSAAQHTQSRSGPLPGPAPVRKVKHVPWRSRSPTDDTARNQVISNRMRAAGLF